MAYAVKYRRGTTAEHASFTGAAGEVTINTTTNELVVHDGVTIGGHVIGSSGGGGGGASTLTDLNITDGTDGQVLTTDGAGTFTFTTLSNSGGNSQTSTIISPSAFAYVNTTSDGSGTNISWSNWNNSAGTLDFTFTTPQSDVNYAVISDVEGYDDVNIQVTSKSTTGFTVSIYNDAGDVKAPGGIGTFSIIVYASTPTLEVSGSSGSSNSGSDEVYILADMPALIAKTGMSTGDKAYLTSNNNLYLYIGTGWYLIASVQNNAPSAITNVNSSYDLSIDGTPTVITAASTDPEGFPLTWSYAVTSGSLGATTISQTDNVFTITPSTNSADEGEFTLTISATDGTNGAVNTATSISLQFQVSVTNSRYTQLLVTAVGTSDNSNVTDSSTNNYSMSNIGEPQAGTFSPYRHGGYSMYFNGIFDQLNIASHESLGFGTGDFTIEFWTKFGGTYSTLSGGAMVDLRSAVDASATVIYLGEARYGAYIQFYDGPANIEVSTGINLTNEWTHIALARESGVWRIFINGNLAASRTSSSNLGSSQPIRIGQGINGYNTAYDGHISDLRIVKGTAIYTSNFTPPDERLESVPNTSLLTCHRPYYADGSSNNHTVILGGHIPKIEPFAPYDYAEYNPTDHGGSVYLDGSSSVTVPDALNLGTDDFTYEFWIWTDENWNPGGANAIAAQSTKPIISAETSGTGVGWTFGPSTLDGFNGLTFSYGLYGSFIVGKFIDNYWIVPKEWTHLVAQRRNGIVEIYVNGVSRTLTTYNQNATWNDGADITSTQTSRTFCNGVNCYISDLRLITGSYVYDGDFIPPSVPLTTATGADLHIKGTDASIIDKAQTGNLTLIGNTSGSTTQVKFADSKSMYFDGSGYVRVEDLGSGPLDTSEGFTIEGWIYPITFYSPSTAFFGLNKISNGDNVLVFVGGNGGSLYYGSTSYWTTSTDVPQNEWSHIAVVVVGTLVKVYLNGSEVISKTLSSLSTINWDDCIFAIGAEYDSANGGGIGNRLTGYIQDFCITKGLARYTANFTPPTSPLEG